MEFTAPAGGDPGVGCARRRVGTHDHILVMGVGNPIAVPCMARLGARRGEIRRLRQGDQQVPGSLNAEGFSKYHLYFSVEISRSASPRDFSVMDTPRTLSGS
jgi:hypothetical protein